MYQYNRASFLWMMASVGVLLSACVSTEQGAPVQESGDSSSQDITMSSEPNGQPFLEAYNREHGFDDENDVFSSSRFNVSERGMQHVPLFLQDVGLSRLLELEEFGGTGEFSASLCRELYAAYNEKTQSDLADDRCIWNLKADGETFEEYGIPIVAYIRELPGDYLFLFIQEEGLGGTPFFTYLYNMKGRTVKMIDRSKIAQDGGIAIHYKSEELWFLSGSGPCVPQTDACAFKKEATYDLRMHTLVIEQEQE